MGHKGGVGCFGDGALDWNDLCGPGARGAGLGFFTAFDETNTFPGG